MCSPIGNRLIRTRLIRTRPVRTRPVRSRHGGARFSGARLSGAQTIGRRASECVGQWPIPTCCERWSDLPSVSSAGATITSAFWNSFTLP